MKEIKGNQTVYLEDYDITVNKYLTYAQIQQIANAVVAASANDADDTWANRQTNIDMLMLYHATDIGKEKLEEIGHDNLLTSGLIEAVRYRIENLYDINGAIDYIENNQRAINKLLKSLPKVLEETKGLQDLMKKHG